MILLNNREQYITFRLCKMSKKSQITLYYIEGTIESQKNSIAWSLNQSIGTQTNIFTRFFHYYLCHNSLKS